MGGAHEGRWRSGRLGGLQGRKIIPLVRQRVVCLEKTVVFFFVFFNNYLEHTNLAYLNNDLLLYTGNIERKYEEAKLMKQKIK